jgi:hypothetical protein
MMKAQGNSCAFFHMNVPFRHGEQLEKNMGQRVRMTGVEGKTVESIEYRVSKYGANYTNLVLIIFTDGTSMEMSPVRCADGPREGQDMIHVMQYAK